MESWQAGHRNMLRGITQIGKEHFEDARTINNWLRAAKRKIEHSQQEKMRLSGTNSTLEMV